MTRHDLFGFIDIIAIDRRTGVLGIQATSWPNVSARIKKALGIYEIAPWLQHGNRFQVWGWRKGTKSVYWECRVVTLEIEGGNIISRIKEIIDNGKKEKPRDDAELGF